MMKSADSAWMLKAVCRDANPEWFYADDNRSQDALNYCEVCPVARECLAYALALEVAWPAYGIWGGTTSADRERMIQTANQVGSARIVDSDDTSYTVKGDNGLKLNLHASALTAAEVENLFCGRPIYVGRTAFYLA